jgi:hypothetical protein
MGCFNVTYIRKYSQTQTDVENWNNDQRYVQYLETIEGYKEWWDPIPPWEAISLDNHFEEKEILVQDLIDIARRAYDTFGIVVPVEDPWLPDPLIYIDKDLDSEVTLPYVPRRSIVYHPEQHDFDLIQKQLPKYDYIRNLAEGKIEEDKHMFAGWETSFKLSEYRMRDRLKIHMPPLVSNVV